MKIELELKPSQLMDLRMVIREEIDAYNETISDIVTRCIGLGSVETYVKVRENLEGIQRQLDFA